MAKTINKRWKTSCTLVDASDFSEAESEVVTEGDRCCVHPLE
ncbi:MAG: hypothetical protein WCE94_15265 [Candidatus Methanoperedens sp.]